MVPDHQTCGEWCHDLYYYLAEPSVEEQLVTFDKCLTCVDKFSIGQCLSIYLLAPC